MAQAPPHAILFLAAHGKIFRFALTKVITVVGAAKNADVRMELPSVSQRHCRIIREEHRYIIEDLQSVQGTFLARDGLEEARLQEETHLLPNDTVRVGAYVLNFVVPAPVKDALVLFGDERRLRLPEVCIVGRAEAGISISDPSVAIRHATIETYAPDAVYLINHTGNDVTTKNGAPVTAPCTLKEGDVVAFSGHSYRVATGEGAHTPGVTRRFTEALAFDPHDKHIVEVQRDNTPVGKNWRTYVTRLFDALQSRRGVLAAQIIIGLSVAGFLAYPFHLTIECECRVAAGAVQKIRAPVSGRVQAVYVKEGDKVRKNELLLRVVDRGLQLEKARSDKELAQARDAVEHATADDRKHRMNELYARRERAENEHERVEASMEQSDVRAGIDGRLMTEAPETLENVVVSIGQELLTVASTERVFVEALVPEADMSEIVSGQRIRANFYTDMSRNYFSDIQAIAPVAEKGALGSVIVVKAPLDNGDDHLIPGTTGIATIVGRRHPGIVLLWKRIVKTFR